MRISISAVNRNNAVMDIFLALIYLTGILVAGTWGFSTTFNTTFNETLPEIDYILEEDGSGFAIDLGSGFIPISGDGSGESPGNDTTFEEILPLMQPILELEESVENMIEGNMSTTGNWSLDVQHTSWNLSLEADTEDEEITGKQHGEMDQFDTQQPTENGGNSPDHFDYTMAGLPFLRHPPVIFKHQHHPRNDSKISLDLNLYGEKIHVELTQPELKIPSVDVPTQQPGAPREIYLTKPRWSKHRPMGLLPQYNTPGRSYRIPQPKYQTAEYKRQPEYHRDTYKKPSEYHREEYDRPEMKTEKIVPPHAETATDTEKPSETKEDAAKDTNENTGNGLMLPFPGIMGQDKAATIYTNTFQHYFRSHLRKKKQKHKRKHVKKHHHHHW